MSGSHPLDKELKAFRRHLRESGSVKASFSPGLYKDPIRKGVDYYRGCQNEDGAIIDPDFALEWHYSTPCFALSAAFLASTGESIYLEPACRAMDWSLNSLVSLNVPQGHSNFYTVMVMQALDLLSPLVPPESAGTWRILLGRIDPESLYDFSDRTVPEPEIHNWNLLALAGELRRYKSNLTSETGYADRHFKYHVSRMTELGFYRDGENRPGNFANPMAYDLLGRAAWMDILDNGYSFPDRDFVAESVDRGVLSQLFFQDPNGEYSCVGRSAQHTWNEAVLAFCAEWGACRFKDTDPLIAEALRRQAFLALRSLNMWEAEPGRLHIVKNRFHPWERQGFEQYSISTTYNLWTIASLTMAAAIARESIPMTEIPSERHSYCVYSGDTFHLLAAASNGCFAAVDLSGDPSCNPTGIVRISKAGIPSSLGPSDGSVPNPRYHTMKEGTFLSYAPWWRDRFGGEHNLAEIVATRLPNLFRIPYIPQFSSSVNDQGVRLLLEWRGGFSGARTIEMGIEMGPEGIILRSSVKGSCSESGILLPLFSSDGQNTSEIIFEENRILNRFKNYVIEIFVEEGELLPVDSEEFGSRIGFLRRAKVRGDHTRCRISFS